MCNKNSLEFYSTVVHGFLTAAASRGWVSKLLLNSWEGRDKSLLLTSAESWAGPTLQTSSSAHPERCSLQSTHEELQSCFPSLLSCIICCAVHTPLKEDTLWLQFRDAGIILLLASLSNGNIVDLWKTQSTQISCFLALCLPFLSL